MNDGNFSIHGKDFSQEQFLFFRTFFKTIVCLQAWMSLLVFSFWRREGLITK